MADLQIIARDGADIPIGPDLPPLLERIYAARGIRTTDELELSLEKLLPPDELNQVHLAADRVRHAVVEQERILVVGDFDADGATSVALALSLLRAMGAENVDFLVPNRFEFGYGLSPDIVRLAADLKPALLITVDNGVS
ncbi:MAG: single-stranded-DNA-specific exonuclease RecJ, partial [Gammaproteobacteria bacterium]|nr:single-stranded-DNA-specific exonuclease RecJ [Gammaproteobacteria bacterium]